MEVLCSECREIATNCLKKISSNQKYLTSQNHFKLENSYTFPKVILHECQGQCKLEYLYGRFVYNMPQNAVIALTVQCFDLRRNQDQQGIRGLP